METKATSLGSTLVVPLVQELAKKHPTTVPPRYVLPDQDPPLISLNSSSLPQLPIINMQRLLSQDSMDSELQKLDHACREWGFFQLINHGVRSGLVEKVKRETEEFFKMPIEEKKKYGQVGGDVEGYGNSFVVSEEQKLNWGDRLYFTTLPPHSRKPHLFPNLPPSFRETLEAYSTELKNLSTKILSLMGKSLGMEDNEMEVLLEGRQAMSFNYYPPCPQPEQVIGLFAHSDFSALTILLEVDDVQGLQIKKDGMWIPIKSLPHAFVINIGDTLEIMSNGTYRSIEHRATVNSLRERMSVATFCSPKLDGEIGPAPSLVTPETPAMFRRIGVIDYCKGLFSRKLDGKSYLDTMRIQNDEGNNTSMI